MAKRAQTKQAMISLRLFYPIGQAPFRPNASVDLLRKLLDAKFAAHGLSRPLVGKPRLCEQWDFPAPPGFEDVQSLTLDLKSIDHVFGFADIAESANKSIDKKKLKAT